MSLAAEHDSLAVYLEQALSPAERSHIGLISFNQWPFALGAVSETALAARDIGSDVTVALWSGKTPLYDTGWRSHRTLARVLDAVEELTRQGRGGRNTRAGAEQRLPGAGSKLKATEPSWR